MTAIVAASDTLFIEHACRRLLDSCADVQIATDPAALAEMLVPHPQPIVVVGGSWPAAGPFLRVASNAGARTLALLTPATWQSESNALECGARAALDSDVSSQVLAAAIGAVNAGLIVRDRPVGALLGAPTASASARAALALDATVERSLPSVQQHLTRREHQILALVADGASNKAIARSLAVSVNTVKFHLAAAFAKLGAATRAEAVAEALRRGELSL